MSKRAARPMPVQHNASSFSVSSYVRSSWSAPPAAPAQSAERAERMEPEVKAGAPVLKTLPESYMKDVLTILTVSPDRIVVYWDASPETMRIYEGNRWDLVVVIDEIEERISVVGGARNWRIQRPGAANWTEARFAPVGKLGEEPPIARLIQHHLTENEHGKAAPQQEPQIEPQQEPQAEWGKGTADENGTRLETAQPDPAPAADTAALTPDMNRARPVSSDSVS